MARGKLKRGLFGAVAAAAVATCLSGAAPALAAGPFYAAPGGSGTTCSQGSRCTLTQATDLAQSGETVLLAPGTYNMTTGLSLTESLRAEDPSNRPELRSTTGNTAVVFDPTSVISDLRFVTSNLGSSTYALNFQVGARAERVEVFASGTSSPFALAMNSGSLISDSVLRATGPGAIAVAGAQQGGTLRNVTAIATGTNSVGFLGSDGYMSPGVTAMTTTVQNSIVRGDAFGFTIFGVAGETVTVNTDHSNYPAANNVAPNAYSFLNGVPQTATPLFTAPGSGDFHQLSSSPTVDAGAAVAGLSATDLDGAPRNQGAAPDIGADELDVPVPAAPSKPKLKCKKPKAKKRKAKQKKCKKKKSKRKSKKRR